VLCISAKAEMRRNTILLGGYELTTATITSGRLYDKHFPARLALPPGRLTLGASGRGGPSAHSEIDFDLTMQRSGKWEQASDEKVQAFIGKTGRYTWRRCNLLGARKYADREQRYFHQKDRNREKSRTVFVTFT
jgi:hypothetical protein